ncbi:hypothetical protein OC846_003820 [Tilletia horrida]|uniref:Ricin B lectin domain-containing protein n=1 Tax=Tilletia horrida TaxID=155126 RepID=A0AAN6JQZ4_9BASI|nr:hypothetical protein OC846_003820 [Tilletia horrida]KAK0565081.1 hypothetical protein OC861_003941 [Tilletia horrida]
MVQLKPTFSVLSTALLLSATVSNAAPTTARVRPFQGNAVTAGKGVAAPVPQQNQMNGQAFPSVQPLVNVQDSGNLAPRQAGESSSSSEAASTGSTVGSDDVDAATPADGSAATDSTANVEPASFAADVTQSPQPQAQTLNWFMADTDTDSPEINMAGPSGPDDDDGFGDDTDAYGSSSTGAIPNQYAVKAPTAGMSNAENDATSPAWRAIPCNGEMFQGAGQTSNEANQYLAVPGASAKFDDGQYHPGQVSASPSVSASKRSIYHRLGENKKTGKKAGKKGKKSKKSKKGKKSKKHSEKKHSKEKRSYDPQTLRVEGSGINIHLIGGDLDPAVYRHDDLIRLRTRSSHVHAHIHEDDYYGDYYRHHSKHWYDHHDLYRHGGKHVHEHVHAHKRDLFATGLRGTVAVLQPLVGSLMDTGLAQQVATLVLAPLNTMLSPAGGAKAFNADPNSAAGANSANAFLLSPSSSQPGTKLMLVDSPNTAMTKPANMTDWKQVQLQATVFNLAADPATSGSPVPTSGNGTVNATTPAATGSGSGTGTPSSTSGQFCATIDTRPPSTLRMELCNANEPGTSQEFLYDPVTGQLTPFVSGSNTTQTANIQGKRQDASASTAAPGAAPASVKLVFIADAPATADTPPSPSDAAGSLDGSAPAASAAAAASSLTGSGVSEATAPLDSAAGSSPGLLASGQKFAAQTGSQQYDDSDVGYGSAVSASSVAAGSLPGSDDGAAEYANDTATMAGQGSAAGADASATRRSAFNVVRSWFSTPAVSKDF